MMVIHVIVLMAGRALKFTLMRRLKPRNMHLFQHFCGKSLSHSIICFSHKPARMLGFFFGNPARMLLPCNFTLSHETEVTPSFNMWQVLHSIIVLPQSTYIPRCKDLDLCLNKDTTEMLAVIKAYKNNDTIWQNRWQSV